MPTSAVAISYKSESGDDYLTLLTGDECKTIDQVVSNEVKQFDTEFSCLYTMGVRSTHLDESQLSRALNDAISNADLYG